MKTKDSIIEGFSPSKKLGQHFLKDKNILHKICNLADLVSTEEVIEIGPGLGDLTEILGERVKLLYTIEKDNKLLKHLSKKFQNSNKIKLLHKDVLDIKFSKFFSSKKLKLVSNLPYSISTPILFKIIEERNIFSKIVVMIQKEVGDRIIATPSTKAYGSLSVMIQTFFKPKILFKISPDAFFPRPKVTSVVLELTPYLKPIVKLKNERNYQKVVRAAFSSRRKMLKNSLSNHFNKEDISKSLTISQIDGKRRAESLSVDEFAELSNAFYELQQSTNSNSISF